MHTYTAPWYVQDALEEEVPFRPLQNVYFRIVELEATYFACTECTLSGSHIPDDALVADRMHTSAIPY